MDELIQEKLMKEEEKEDNNVSEVPEPVSPTGQYFNSSVLNVCILAVLEFEIPFDDSLTFTLLKNLFLPISPRFSSIMVIDEHGVKQWKRVSVKLEDHVNVPVFPTGKSPESYDKYVQDYISEIATDHLPQNRPLWEIHIIKYPTSKASGLLVFKLHHALGDGFSLMGALFSCLKRADDPSLPLQFPSSRSELKVEDNEKRISKRFGKICSVFFNTVTEFSWSLMKSTLVEDGRTTIRSGSIGVEFRPIVISTVTFYFDQIKQIKAKVGGTVNDIITGMIFYGTRLYMQATSQDLNTTKCTALVLLSTRMVNGYQTLEDMIKPDAESPWGNQFGFIHVSIPDSIDVETVNPLDFILKAKQMIKKKRNTLAVYLTGKLLELMRKFRGPEIAAKYIHRTLMNTSMTISNLIGPTEQMALADHPVKELYFMVVGVPQSITITMMSYMGKLTLAVGTEKGFIDHQLFNSCLEKAFERIFKAAVN